MDPAAVPLHAPQTLQVLPCLNQAGLKPWDCGVWDETTLPSALRGTIRDPERYLQAIQRINKVHHNKVRFRSESAQTLLVLTAVILAILGTVATILLVIQYYTDITNRLTAISFLVTLYIKIFMFRKQECKRIMRLLIKAVGKANSLLCKESILIGCQKNAELVLVYVPLSACRDELGRRFDDTVVKYSCTYAWCLAQGQMPFTPCPDKPGHLQGAVCFCQYVHHHKHWCC